MEQTLQPTGDVFISYRHCHEDLVKSVIEELKRRGISYFVDWKDIDFGEKYSKIIPRAIAECKVLLLFWTEDAEESEDILSEVSMARNKKKKIIPYQIGNFNPEEHDSLCYYLSTISAYRVTQQTPETIVEVVKRIQQALEDSATDSSSPEPVSPVPPSDDSNINEDRPPLPEELVRIQSEIKTLLDELLNVKAFNHGDLIQENEAVDQAQRKFDECKKRKDLHWQNMSPPMREQLEKILKENPNCTEDDLPFDIENMSNEQYLEFMKQFHSGKNYETARLKLEKTVLQRQKKCNRFIRSIELKIQKDQLREKVLLQKFMNTLLLAILEKLSGYNDPEALYPAEEIAERMDLLFNYKLGWKAQEINKRTQILWEERPSLQEAAKRALSKPGRQAGERKTIMVNHVEFAFRWCPAGSFDMGLSLDEQGFWEFGSQHKVTLTKGFWMLETVVTQKQWKAIMGNNPSYFKGDDLPVESISWFDCQKFCDKSATLGLPVQLPTEAQWEYACRAGKTTKFFWGNSLSPDKANFGEQVNKTTPVRSYAPNAWGLYDMHGNVWEWCQDWRADYPSEHVTDPTGPSSGSRRIDRGGCWKSSEKYCRSGYRDDSDPKERIKSVGFRCVMGQNN